MTKIQKKIIKRVGDAYKLGHTHGLNQCVNANHPLLKSHGDECKREDETWGKIAYEIVALMNGEKSQNGITSTRFMIKTNNLTKALKKLTAEVESLAVDIIAFDTGKDVRKIKPKRKAK